MKNIDWRVEHLRLEDYPMCVPRIHAELTGVIKGPVDFDKVDDNILRCLNHEISRPEIVDVIFNDPATIVFWSDKTKTVVKCQDGDIYDPEKGLAMAIVKKVYGNKGNYFNKISKWTEKYESVDEDIDLLDILAAFGIYKKDVDTK